VELLLVYGIVKSGRRYSLEFNQLVSPSLKDLFVEEVTENILSEKLAVGERLPNERELAEKMKVSRAVINGGLNVLAQRGFIEIVPRKGAFVADYKRRGRIETLEAVLKYSGGHFDPVTLDSIYEVRTCIERHIAELAAKRRTDRDLADLWGQMEIIAGLDDPETLGSATHEFYHLLSVASGNIIYPLNIEAYRVIYIPLLTAIYRHIPKEFRLKRLKKLVDLIEKKESGRAADCITEIIQWGRRVLSEQYRPGQEF
jgi:DNA-binding FadR family transcriptional regulator